MVKQNRCYKAPTTLKRGGIWLFGIDCKDCKKYGYYLEKSEKMTNFAI